MNLWKYIYDFYFETYQNYILINYHHPTWALNGKTWNTGYGYMDVNEYEQYEYEPYEY